MKTLLAAFLLVVAALSLESCGTGPTEPGDPVTPGPPTPVVTTPPSTTPPSTTPTPCRNPKFPCES